MLKSLYSQKELEHLLYCQFGKVEFLGRGGYSSCWLKKDKVIKLYHYPDIDVFEKEISILSQLNSYDFSVGIPRYLSHGRVTHESCLPFLCYEFIESNKNSPLDTDSIVIHLAKFINEFQKISLKDYAAEPEDNIDNIMDQVVETEFGKPLIEYAKNLIKSISSNYAFGQNKILIHNDLTCDNILLEGDTLSVIDFASVCFAIAEYEFRHLYHMDKSFTIKLVDKYNEINSNAINLDLVEVLSYGRLLYLGTKNINLNQKEWGIYWLNLLSNKDKNFPHNQLKNLENCF